MTGEQEQWLGPRETARRLGVTTKALRVYEREGLVVPHRAHSRWRLYGPTQIARLHQIIVLRDLGLSLKSIRMLIARKSALQEVLRLQRESLLAQQGKINRAIARIEAAQNQLDEGRELSLGDLAALAKETVVQQAADHEKFAARLEALIAEQDPTGQASRAFDAIKEDVAAMRVAKGDDFNADIKAMMEEARRLKEAGDVNSEAARGVILRLRSRTAGIRRPAEKEIILDAYAKTAAEAQARSEALAFDPAVFEFIARIRRGMQERGELDS